MFGGIEKFQTDPHWHDLLLFHEYFHGDNGAGIGASHQTGWTGTVALLLLAFGGCTRGTAAAAPSLIGLTAPCASLAARRSTRSTPRSGWSGSDASAAAARAGRGARRGMGRAGGAAGRRRLADGRVAAQPGRPADRAGGPRARRGTARRCPTSASEDVIGSPYCVRDYVVDERFGGGTPSPRPRAQLADRGLG